MTAKLIGSGLPDTKALSVDQFFDYITNAGDEPTRSLVYKAVGWVYRCVQLRANALNAVPHGVYRPGSEDEIEEPPVKVEDLLWDLEADMCGYGAGYLLRNRLGRATTELQRLNPKHMEVKVSRDPTRGIIAFEQHVTTPPRRYKPEYMIYFRYYNPDDDLGPGVSPAQVALADAGLALNATQWGSKFFEHGAIPAVILHTEQSLPDKEIKRVGSAWKKLTRGVERAWRTIVLRRGLKPEVVGQPVKDLALGELNDLVRGKIANAFGVPETMLADAANYATAQSHRLGFYQDTIVPEAVRIARVLNEQLYDDFGLEFRFRPNEIEAIQAEEAKKAESMAFTFNGIMGPAYEANLVSIDEARRVIDALLQSADLPELDATFEPEERTPPQLLAPSGGSDDDGGGPGSSAGNAPSAENIENRTQPKALADDLDKWQRKAVRRFEEGHPEKGLEFESDAISPETQAAIAYALGLCQTTADITDVFDQVAGKGALFQPKPRTHDRPPTDDPEDYAPIDAADLAAWDKALPDFAGLLDAAVINRERYDAEEPQ